MMEINLRLPDAIARQVQARMLEAGYSDPRDLMCDLLDGYLARPFPDVDEDVMREMQRRLDALERGEYDGKMIDGEEFSAKLERLYPDED